MPDQVDPLEKAETRTLSLPRGDWEYLTARGTATRSDRSKYVRQLLAKDRAELAAPINPDAVSPDILQALLRRLRPELLPDYEQYLASSDQATEGKLSQPRVLALLLETYLAALADLSLPEPERPLRIADREKLDAVVRAIELGDTHLAEALVRHTFALSAASKKGDDSAFLRRWRAELNLPPPSLETPAATPQTIPSPSLPPDGRAATAAAAVIAERKAAKRHQGAPADTR